MRENKGEICFKLSSFSGGRYAYHSVLVDLFSEGEETGEELHLVPEQQHLQQQFFLNIILGKILSVVIGTKLYKKIVIFYPNLIFN